MNDATAPELPATLEWLNSPPIRLGGCRGGVVALVFWSAGSAYCHNVLDRLRHLQARYPARLRVIAVHVPKFDAERDAGTARHAAARLRLGFPVAHDADFVAWQHFGIRAWPSVVIVDRDGQIRGVVAGDAAVEELAETLEALVSEVASDRFADTPASGPSPAEGVLAYPAGLAVSENRLFVADGGHHRILECTHEGRVLRIFGSGHAGLSDGRLDEAAFQRPRGLCLVGGAMVVADAGNHALRRIDLGSGQVTTLAGGGEPGLPREGGIEEPSAVRLDGPWDVAGNQERVFIAMAGRNQVWEFAIAGRELRCLAGSGEMGVRDGVRGEARFAQPAALCLLQKTLYVADAAGSAIRSVNIDTGKVHTLVGGADVFEFGNVDGKRSTARMQYPCGLAVTGERPQLWVADSYNGVFKRLKLGGGGLSSIAVEPAALRPTAMRFGGGALWAVDTDGHAIVRIDPGSGQAQRLQPSE